MRRPDGLLKPAIHGLLAPRLHGLRPCGAHRPALRQAVGLGLAALLLWSGAATALETDAAQPVMIEAGRLTLDEKTSTSVYRGDVRLAQGSIRITADELTVIGSRKGAERVVLTGSPATFRQTPAPGAEDIVARAARMEYEMATDRLVLEGEAHLTQGRDEFRSERIVYDTRQGLVRAGSDGPGEDTRVKIILHPKPRDGENGGPP